MKFLAVLAMFTMLSLTGCETMQGLGKDIQNLGDTIEEKAKKKE